MARTLINPNIILKLFTERVLNDLNGTIAFAPMSDQLPIPNDCVIPVAIIDFEMQDLCLDLQAFSEKILAGPARIFNTYLQDMGWNTLRTYPIEKYQGEAEYSSIVHQGLQLRYRSFFLKDTHTTERNITGIFEAPWRPIPVNTEKKNRFEILRDGR